MSSLSFGPVDSLRWIQRERDRDEADRDVDPEDPVPGDAVDDRAADHRADRDREAGDAAPRAEDRAALLGRRLAGEDRERERRDDRRAHALERTGDDQHLAAVESAAITEATVKIDMPMTNMRLRRSGRRARRRSAAARRTSACRRSQPTRGSTATRPGPPGSVGSAVATTRLSSAVMKSAIVVIANVQASLPCIVLPPLRRYAPSSRTKARRGWHGRRSCRAVRRGGLALQSRQALPGERLRDLLRRLGADRAGELPRARDPRRACCGAPTICSTCGFAICSRTCSSSTSTASAIWRRRS